MVRSFTVRTDKKDLVSILGEKLDRELVALQNAGWKIIKVESMPVKEWEYPKHFKSKMFIIIAEKDDTKE